MKTILVPVDFSENAQRALTAAKTVAKNTGARVYVLHAYQPYIPDISSGIATLPIYEEMEESFRTTLQENVDFLTREGITAESIWVQGPVVETIQKEARAKNADLIVIGRTGKGGFIDKLFGSSATSIVKQADIPVLIIPPQAVVPKAFKEVVYATQLEFEENHIIEKVIALNQSWGSRLTFLKVNSLTQPNIQDDRQYIDQIKAQFNFTDDDFVIREAGSVIDGIEQYADELKADLLIVSARERGFLEALLIDPSVSKRLVMQTHIPLLVYHLNK